jgi:hypothetical protein
MGLKARRRYVHLRAQPGNPPEWWPTQNSRPLWVYINDDGMSWSTIPDDGHRIVSTDVADVKRFYLEDFEDEEDWDWDWKFRVETVR